MDMDYISKSYNAAIFHKIQIGREVKARIIGKKPTNAWIL